MDKIDKMILKALSENSQITTTQLVPIIHLSIPAINKRIEKLKSSGVIKGFTILTDSAKVGRPVSAYIFVVLDSPARADSFAAFAKGNDNVQECCTVTGNYDMQLRVNVPNIRELENIIQQIKRRQGVVKSQTTIILTEHKYRPTVLPEDEDKE